MCSVLLLLCVYTCGYVLVFETVVVCILYMVVMFVYRWKCAYDFPTKWGEKGLCSVDLFRFRCLAGFLFTII